MGKVIINGKAYDSLTGLQIHDKKPIVVTDHVEPVKVEELQQSASESHSTVAPKDHHAKSKRVSKQARLAAAVAEEFASEQPAKKVKASHKDPLGSNKNSPMWISNFVEGHDPIEIENISIAKEANGVFPKTHKQRSVASHHPKVHLQKSQTLNRRFVHKPEPIGHVQVGRKIASAPKHPSVRHFAEPKIESPKVSVKVSPVKELPAETPDKPFVPVVSHKSMKSLSGQSYRKTEISSVDLKEILIKNQLDQPVDRKSRRHAEKAALKFSSQRHFSKTSLVTAALAVVVLGGYFTYVNMPYLSIRVAASRAGVDTESPYTPNGYSLDGPVAYSPGRITIKYKSNSDGRGYSIIEQNTNLSTHEAASSLAQGGTYEITSSNGVDIYRYGTNAVWVKDGVLYNLKNNDLLSEDQISKIVESV